ncbi:MAG TPA: glutathione S-transferase family protein [Kofleriaceae bacterium]|jgi:glutathione S-transferase
MLLYHDPRAPNPRRVRWFFAEKNVAYDTIEVSIDARAHQTAEFRRKNPIALLPVLELADGKVLRESIAICRYIEELYPDPNLFGTDAWERAVIEQWNRHAELELFLPIVQVFRNTNGYWKDRIKQAPEFADIMRELLVSRFDWIDGELATRPYIAGPRFSVADITACVAIDFARVAKIRIDATTHPHFAGWHERMKERAAYKA